MRALLFFVVLFFSSDHDCAVKASITGSIIKHFKNFNPVINWARNSPRIAETNADEIAPQFENGYFVETLVDGNKLGFVPYTIRVSLEGELFAVDSENNNVFKITPPLSQYSRARLVAGSFQGYSGHVDGKPSDARFTHPKGVAMDKKGNVYVADTANLAIRKIGESGVTTIAGGKSTVAGYRDGPSEDAKFSADFDIVYVARTCSLLVVDRGNAALRQISLQQDDCDHQYNSISTSDIAMVLGAILAGYLSCLVQQGLGNSFFSKKPSPISKVALVVESLKEETVAGWPSPGQLISDLAKLAFEALCSSLLNIIVFPQSFLPEKKGLTPLKDNLILPEDKVEQPPLPATAKKQVNSSAVESVGSSNINIDTPVRPLKTVKPPSKYKDSKHRSTKKQDFADFYTGEATQMGSKSQKERSRHRHREKSTEMTFAAAGVEAKCAVIKPKEYINEQKFDPKYSMNKYATEKAYRF